MVEWGCIEFSQSNDQHQWDYAQHLMSRTPASLNPHRVFCRRCTPTRRRFGRDQPVARQAARVAFALNESSLLQSRRRPVPPPVPPTESVCSSLWEGHPFLASIPIRRARDCGQREQRTVRQPNLSANSDLMLGHTEHVGGLQTTTVGQSLKCWGIDCNPLEHVSHLYTELRE